MNNTAKKEINQNLLQQNMDNSVFLSLTTTQLNKSLTKISLQTPGTLSTFQKLSLQHLMKNSAFYKNSTSDVNLIKSGLILK